MLRALASYFFGGIENETPEAPIECETREVNDWLVVNLPDHNKDSIILNDDDDTYEIDDDDIRNDVDDDDAVEVDASDANEMDLDEDDILLSLSILMMPPDAETISTEFSNEESIYESGLLQPSFPTCVKPPISSYYFYCEDLENNRLRAEKCMSMIRESLPIPTIEEYMNVVKLGDSHTEALLDMVIPSRKHRTKRDDIVSEFERKHKVSVQVLDLTSPPLFSTNYVNHRRPEKLLNHDLLQRIKELEPEQQAVQRSIKKNLTRGQLNRQNKNYMYETSSKKNRRSNRQRIHSGANNNRKC